jgi:hypothetical protein
MGINKFKLTDWEPLKIHIRCSSYNSIYWSFCVCNLVGFKKKKVSGRLDSQWYESTKICLEKLYDKVVDGGTIIIDDYGHWVGCKNAVDEFRHKHNILNPLIQ